MIITYSTRSQARPDCFKRFPCRPPREHPTLPPINHHLDKHFIVGQVHEITWEWDISTKLLGHYGCICSSKPKRHQCSHIAQYSFKHFFAELCCVLMGQDQTQLVFSQFRNHVCKASVVNEWNSSMYRKNGWRSVSGWLSRL